MKGGRVATFKSPRAEARAARSREGARMRTGARACACEIRGEARGYSKQVARIIWKRSDLLGAAACLTRKIFKNWPLLLLTLVGLLSERRWRRFALNLAASNIFLRIFVIRRSRNSTIPQVRSRAHTHTLARLYLSGMWCRRAGASN